MFICKGTDERETEQQLRKRIIKVQRQSHVLKLIQSTCMATVLATLLLGLGMIFAGM